MDKKIEYHMTAFRKLCSTTAITTSTALLLAVPTIGQAESEGFSHNLDFQIAHEDNVYLQETGETSSTSMNFAATSQYFVKNPSNEFSLTASANLGGYDVDKDDNYIDLTLGGNALAYTSKKTTIFGSANYLHGHDRRGDGRTDLIAIPTAPDVYNESKLTGGFGYGVDQAGSPRAEFKIGLSDKTYSNNRATTRLSDLKQTRGKATLFYKLQPSTSLLVQASSTQFDYVYATLDSTETNVMAGVTWEITGQTSGSVKAGSSTKTFDDSTIAEGQTSTWEVSANWTPLSYSNFSLSSTHNFGESRGTGDYTETTGSSLSWDHGWNNQFATNLSVTSTAIDYSNSPREDSLASTTLGLNYKAHEDINIQVGLTNSQRDSNEAGADYTNNRISAQLSVNL